MSAEGVEDVEMTDCTKDQEDVSHPPPGELGTAGSKENELGTAGSKEGEDDSMNELGTAGSKENELGTAGSKEGEDDSMNELGTAGSKKGEDNSMNELGTAGSKEGEDGSMNELGTAGSKEGEDGSMNELGTAGIKEREDGSMNAGEDDMHSGDATGNDWDNWGAATETPGASLCAAGANRGGHKWKQNRWSARDTDHYKQGYPGKADGKGQKNLEFYKNQRRCEPDGLLVDEIHFNWFGDYWQLERSHGYIQWLFPIREPGLNWDAQELNASEIKAICEDEKAHKRILVSYKMMLNFYGMKLVSEETGEVKRAEHWRDRFYHLNYSMHNYMRITRILKCLGEFSYEHLKAPFIKFVLHEAIVKRTLNRTLDSCLNYWVGVLRNDKDLEEVTQLYERLTRQAGKKGKKTNRSNTVGEEETKPENNRSNYKPAPTLQ